jgi:NodT family efflux transporter outer membrane factor (OMF) lipoprotein
MSKTHYAKTLAVLVAAAMLTACAHFGRDRDFIALVEVPEAFSLYGDVDTGLGAWWTQFQSESLNALVEEALSSGFTVQEAWYRLEQAQAAAVRSGADLYPDLRATGGARRTESQDSGAAGGDFYALGLASTYELDLWGRVRSVSRAGARDLEASREDYRTAAISLSGRVAETWLGLVAQREQLRLLKSQLQTSNEVLELLRLRFRNGLSGAVDVYQQDQVVAEVASAIPLVRAQEKALNMELAVLVGRPPAGLETGDTALPEATPLPRTGVPSDLLAQRPDIRAAGARLLAADDRVAAARAARLPAIRLTADIGYEATETATLFDNWIANLAGNLAAPLFDAGRRRAEVRQAEALADERLVAYRRTVYEALREVETALVREEEQRAHVEGVRRQLEVARRTLKESSNRYRNGVTDYLPVLTQLLVTQRLERNLIVQQAEQYRYRVALCRALGGSWMDHHVISPVAGGYHD